MTTTDEGFELLGYEQLACILADRLAAREAERAEMVALLELLSGPQGTGRCVRAHLGQDGCSVSPRCSFHAGKDLLAKLRGTP